MRVKMITLAAEPGGVYRPGQIVDLDDGTARAFIAGGYAKAVPVGSPSAPQPEAAAIEPAEAAMKPAGKRRKAR